MPLTLSSSVNTQLAGNMMHHAITGCLHAAILTVGMQARPLQSTVTWSVWIFLTIQHLSILSCNASTQRLQLGHPSSRSLFHNVRLWKNLQRLPSALAPFPLEIALWMVEDIDTPLRGCTNAPWEPLYSRVPRPAGEMNRDAASVAHWHGQCGNKGSGDMGAHTQDFSVHVAVIHQLYAAQGACKRSSSVL